MKVSPAWIYVTSMRTGRRGEACSAASAAGGGSGTAEAGTAPGGV